MEKITILNQNFYYRIAEVSDGYIEDPTIYTYTYFYLNESDYEKRLWYRCSGKNNYYFLVDFDIKNPKISKEDLRQKLEKEFKDKQEKEEKQKEILNRQKEIERGDLI